MIQRMNILAIGAHPDDIEYGCAGTLVKYADRGHRIHLMILTGGEEGGSSKERQHEQSQSNPETAGNGTLDAGEGLLVRTQAFDEDGRKKIVGDWVVRVNVNSPSLVKESLLDIFERDVEPRESEDQR